MQPAFECVVALALVPRDGGNLAQSPVRRPHAKRDCWMALQNVDPSGHRATRLVRGEGQARKSFRKLPQEQGHYWPVRGGHVTKDRNALVKFDERPVPGRSAVVTLPPAECRDHVHEARKSQVTVENL